MARKTRTRSRGAAGSGRRGFLFKVGTGAIAAASLFVGLESTGAFSAVSSIRESNVAVDSGGSALVGIVGQGPVQKGEREAMVKFTNNTNEELTITVTLDNSSDGTLYNNEGNSGSSVTLTVGAGNSQFVDILADVKGTIGYSVSVSSSALNLNTVRSVESEAGNQAGAVRIVDPDQNQDFTAEKSTNDFVVDPVDVRDDDGDNDLDKIEFRVREGGSGGTVVGSKDVTNPPGDRYFPQNGETIQPDSGYSIKAGTTYSLTVTGYDVDGNFESSTVEDTTSGTPTPTPTDTPSGVPPVFDNITFTKTGRQCRKFKVDADVHDDDGNLDRVEVVAIRTKNGNTDYSNTISVTGTDDSISDTTTKLSNGNEYRIEVTVYDTDGQNNTETHTETTGGSC